MPGLYAHYLFGSKVKDLLPKELKCVVGNHSEEYLLGLQGPDILFYYHPLRRNSVTGWKIHRQSAYVFLEHAANVLRKDNNDGRLAYMIGFICHFTLDSGCHPVIHDFMERDGLSHAAMEAEFDRLLMRQQRIDPSQFSPKPLLPKRKDAMGCAEPFYPGTVHRQLNRSLFLMRCCLSAFYSPRKTCKSMLNLVIFFSGLSEKSKGLLTDNMPKPEYSMALEHLLSTFSNATVTAQGQIENFLEVVYKGTELNTCFARNFE